MLNNLYGGFMLTSKENLIRFIDVSRKILRDNVQVLVPALIGNTGAGKTSLAMEIARHYNIPCVRLLLHSMLSEEILGLPRTIKEKTVWTIPDWVKDEPTLYLIDELDKVRPDEIGSILTLLAERRVRDKYLHPDSIIIVALQPLYDGEWADETGLALRARLAFFPFTYKNSSDYLKNKYGIEFPFEPSQFQSPILDIPSPRQWEFGIKLLEYGEGDFLETFLHSDHIQILKEMYENRTVNPTIDPEAWAKLLNKKPELIEKEDPITFVENIGYLFLHLDAPNFFKVWKIIHYKLSFDEWEKVLSNLASFLWSNFENGQEINILGNTESVEEFENEFNEFLKEIEKYLKNIVKQNKDSKNGKNI